MLEKTIKVLKGIINEEFEGTKFRKKIWEREHPHQGAFYLDFFKGTTKDLGLFGQREKLTFRIVYIEGQENKSSDENQRFFVYDKLMNMFSKGWIETDEGIFSICDLKGGGYEEEIEDKMDTKENYIYLDVTFLMENKRGEKKEEEAGVPATKLKVGY